ncbi:hypothetical protein LXL04_002051 [Taraxacum kok-saghyz]
MCTYTKKKIAHMQIFEKKSRFFQNFFATGLVVDRFLAPRSRFFEKVNEMSSRNVIHTRQISQLTFIPHTAHLYHTNTIHSMIREGESAGYLKFEPSHI